MNTTILYSFIFSAFVSMFPFGFEVCQKYCCNKFQNKSYGSAIRPVAFVVVFGTAFFTIMIQSNDCDPECVFVVPFNLFRECCNQEMRCPDGSFNWIGC